MKPATCRACGVELSESEEKRACARCGTATPTRRQSTQRRRPATDFDPMEVLSAPVDQSDSPPPADTTTPPERPLDEETANSRAAEAPGPEPEAEAARETRTTSAAQSAMSAMKRKTAPYSASDPAPTAVTAGDDPTPIRQRLSSPREMLDLLRERPLHAALAGTAILWLLVVGSRGCRSDRIPTYPVRGRVVFADGSRVRTGKIEFESSDYGTTSTGTINEDGSFVLGTYESDDGAPEGQHKVIVMQLVVRDGTVTHTKDHGAPVDPRFARYETSGLSATVDAGGTNDLIIQVETQRQRPDHQHE